MLCTIKARVFGTEQMRSGESWDGEPRLNRRTVDVGHFFFLIAELLLRFSASVKHD
jgi:hypothetical protein